MYLTLYNAIEAKVENNNWDLEERRGFNEVNPQGPLEIKSGRQFL
jgi:hypothetical protein